MPLKYRRSSRMMLFNLYNSCIRLTYSSANTMATLCRILAPLMLFSSAFLLTTPASCIHNKTDHLSLLAFKNAMHDPSGALNSWDNHTQFCRWKGIRCSSKHPDRVVAIILRSQSLVGSLSPFIGNISFLRAFDLKNNSFHGIIPDEIGRLRRLEYIDFSNNSFSGALPRNLSQCSNLVYLNLIDNNISGTIPLEFSSFHKIEHLGLASNKISGHIPPFIGNLTSLTQLSLARCNLMGEIPESLGQLTNMEYFRMSRNSFTGSIPSALFNISTMLSFAFDQNQLQGSIPSSLGLTLPSLVRLTLGFNQFSGTFPTSISNLSSLERIDIPENYFTGPMPTTLGRLSRLRHFLIAYNSIRDDINFISSLVNCTNLQILDIAENPISGAMPNLISNLSSNLWAINIQKTQVHGNLPSRIGNLAGLTFLSLYGNSFEGFIPSSIGELLNLQTLSLGANRFTGEIPNSLGNITSLNSLSMEMNQLSGRIPKSLNHCVSLLSLDLSTNNLSGPIPPEIMTLSSISVKFDLSFNALNDSLPYEVYHLTHLSELDLSNNRLSGVIPNSLGGCTSLERLDLEGNLFEGEIPGGLSSLKGLLYLDLSQNNLSGVIPSFLDDLQLQRLNLSFNRFEGEVPILGVFANQSALSVEGNKDLCGGILELNLPPCTLTNSSKKSSQTLLKILIPIGATIFLCFVIFLYKKRKPKTHLPSSLPLPLISTPFQRLSYADLLKATNGFGETNLVGSGRFGSVYKGNLDGGQTLIAVKVLNLLVYGASKSFTKECNALKNARHRNLLKILSVCERTDINGNDFKCLVYEFKERGSLEKWLHHNRESREKQDAELSDLDLIQRLNIAIDVAHGLEYLHCGTESTIIHGDLKPSNILLDHDMTAYVGDFGLAKVLSSEVPSHESSSLIGINGTIGYVPPEYSMGNQVSTHGDVYSFGILLLEIFTNRRPTDEAFRDHLNLHNVVAAALPNAIEEIVDSLVWIRQHDMNDGKVKDCLASILSIGVVCSMENPKDRMSMTQVVCELDKIKNNYFA